MSNDKMVEILNAGENNIGEVINDCDDKQMQGFFGKDFEAIKMYANAGKAKKQRGDSLLVFLPGLTGSVLADQNTDEVLWVNPKAILQGHINHLDLAADGITDATAGVKVHAPNPLWVAYAKIVMRLRYEFELVVFPFDWRKSTMYLADLLANVIDDAIAKSQFDQVTLVGHSMGGLVIMDYLLGTHKAKAEKLVKRAITLGSPFKGAMEAVSSLAHPNDPKVKAMKLVNKNNNLHQFLASAPGMYYLLPAPNNLYDDWNPLPDVDIYDPTAWKEIGVSINESHLAEAKSHHELYANADPQVPLTNVVGTNYKTPIRILGQLLNAMPRAKTDGWEGGDGTVEVKSALFKGGDHYYLQEAHIELVLDDNVIKGVMDLADGGECNTLVKDLDKVVLDDQIMRSGGEKVEKADQEVIAQKIENDEQLNHEEVKAMFNILAPPADMEDDE